MKRELLFLAAIFALLSMQGLYGQNDFAFRINAGGTETVYNGETFLADEYFGTGNTLDRPQTGLPEPYQTFRYGPSKQMSYDIPVPDGEYTVNLYFAELWFGATGGGLGGVGNRVFDVYIEGQLEEDNLDIFAEVGADAMLIKSHTVTVTGGVLDIDFDSRDAVGGERHPVINGIEIFAAAPPQSPMIVTWQTDASHPLGVAGGLGVDIGAIHAPGSGNYTVDWGDNTGVTTNTSSHVYSVDGTYTISISGDIQGVKFGSSSGSRTGTEPKLISIDQWGDMVWTTAKDAFVWCGNLDVTATDSPNLSQVTDMSSMFEECESLVGNSTFNNWDVSNITDMGSTFRGTEMFNAPIGNWDVGNVVSMEGTFYEATVFDQDISNWDFSSVQEAILPTLSVEKFSTTNYDNLLLSLETQALNSGIRFDMGDSNYCLGADARQQIINISGWTFTDAGLDVGCQVPNNFALRINAGGTETEYIGETFMADEYFDTGNKLDRPQTGLLEPYQTFRYSPSKQMSYNIPVPDGEYTVNLYFAELWFGATDGGLPGAGRRVFDVSIEGQLVQDNLDVFAEVGAEAMLIKSHTIMATGGILDIDFSSLDADGGERHPIINAIEILSKKTEELIISGFTYYRSGGSAPEPAGSLNDGDKIYQTESTGEFFAGFEADVSNAVKSVRYELVGLIGTENIVRNVNELPLWGLGDEIGVYTVTATPYSESNSAGEQGNPLSITYEILNHCEAISIEIFNASSCKLSDGYAILKDDANNQNGYRSVLDEMWVYNEELAVFKASNLAPGTYEVNYENYGCTVNKSFVIEADDCPNPDFELRINAGGGATIYNGKTFVADEFYDAGRTLSRPQTGLEEPYRTFRYSPSQEMAYNIPVPKDGEYTVVIHFAELWFGATGGGSGGFGRRVFDVNMEGYLAEDNLDVYLEAGGAETMLTKSYVVHVSDRVLNIDFSSLTADGGERHPIVNAIEVLSVDSQVAKDEFWLEAECAVIEGDLSIINDSATSGGKYVLAPPVSGSNNETNRITLEVTAAESGVYSIYALLNNSSEDNTIYFRAINELPQTFRYSNRNVSDEFKWYEIVDVNTVSATLRFYLEEGVNQIPFWYFSPGLGIDAFFITKLNKKPVGMGNDDNSCNSNFVAKNVQPNLSRLAPNPARMSTTLTFKNPVELTTIQVFDVLGRLVHTYSGPDVVNKEAFVLQVNDLKSGTYFLKAIDSQGVKHQKQMVIKK